MFVAVRSCAPVEVRDRTRIRWPGDQVSPDSPAPEQGAGRSDAEAERKAAPCLANSLPPRPHRVADLETANAQHESTSVPRGATVARDALGSMPAGRNCFSEMAAFLASGTGRPRKAIIRIRYIMEYFIQSDFMHLYLNVDVLGTISAFCAPLRTMAPRPRGKRSRL
jgi:hypothetical protein